MLQDPYILLGLHPGASADEIRKAYRMKAKLCHPDISKSPESANDFIRLKDAFNLLMQNRLSENTGRLHGFAHPRDPYFQHRNGYCGTYFGSNVKPVEGDEHINRDFLKSKIGFLLYIFMHILFLATGFIILISPLYSILTQGMDRYGSFFYSVFNIVAAMTFGVIMIVKISGSFLHFIKKPL